MTYVRGCVRGGAGRRDDRRWVDEEPACAPVDGVGVGMTTSAWCEAHVDQRPSLIAVYEEFTLDGST